MDELQRGKRGKTLGIVFLIHGSAGLLSTVPAPPDFDNLGENMLACSGYVVVIPHYLEVSGIRSTFDETFMHQEAAKWLVAIDDVISYVAAKYAGNKLFLYGDSLGGYLATFVAIHRQDVAALSVLSTGFYNKDATDPHLPPILIQHGEADTLIPVAEARAFDAMILHRVQHWLITYPGLGHNLYYATNGKVTETTIALFSRFKRK